MGSRERVVVVETRLSLEPRLEAWGRAKNLVLLLELGLLNYRGSVHVFQLRGNEYKKLLSNSLV